MHNPRSTEHVERTWWRHTHATHVLLLSHKILRSDNASTYLDLMEFGIEKSVTVFLLYDVRILSVISYWLDASGFEYRKFSGTIDKTGKNDKLKKIKPSLSVLLSFLIVEKIEKWNSPIYIPRISNMIPMQTQDFGIGSRKVSGKRVKIFSKFCTKNHLLVKRTFQTSTSNLCSKLSPPGVWMFRIWQKKKKIPQKMFIVIYNHWFECP